MLIRTALTERLGLKRPVLLAPMAGIGSGVLAAAVSRAGGLGLIGAGYGGEARLRQRRQWAADPPGLLRSLVAERRRCAAAREAGDFDAAAVILGEAADPVHAIAPAQRIVADLVADAAAELRRAHGLLMPAQRAAAEP